VLQEFYLVLKDSILVLVQYSMSHLQKPHRRDGLFIKLYQE